MASIEMMYLIITTTGAILKVDIQPHLTRKTGRKSLTTRKNVMLLQMNNGKRILILILQELVYQIHSGIRILHIKRKEMQLLMHSGRKIMSLHLKRLEVVEVVLQNLVQKVLAAQQEATRLMAAHKEVLNTLTTRELIQS